MFYPTYYGRHDPVATSSANEAAREARTATTRMKVMESEIERLLMISEALWRILKEEHGYGDEKLREQVMQVDLRDGELDGRVAPSQARACPACQRTLS